MRRLLIVFAIATVWVGCTKKEQIKYGAADAEIIYACEKKLTDIIVTDIFTPPVASRVYVYPMLAAYEAVRFCKEGPCYVSHLKGFSEMPMPMSGDEYDFTVAAVQAFCETARKVVFSKQTVTDFQQVTLEKLKGRNSAETYQRSVDFGTKVADAIAQRIGTDNYKQTRGMERFEVTSETGRWVPTPPDYADAIEPHWPKMMTLVLDSASQFNTREFPPYNEAKDSPFWKEITEVYDYVNNIKEESDEMEILTFWDDNPFVSRHKGHLMFQDKKMTPGGHWLSVTRVISRHNQADVLLASKAYAVTAVALYDAFVSSWSVKYEANRIRPETVINTIISKDWHPHLVSPPFPAFTSGHSTISAAAAEALTGIYGDNFAYTDSTEFEYGLPIRSFKSFREAALEASISRVYAGIHYRSDCEKGNEQGRKVGQLVLSKLQVQPVENLTRQD